MQSWYRLLIKLPSSIRTEGLTPIITDYSRFLFGHQDLFCRVSFSQPGHTLDAMSSRWEWDCWWQAPTCIH